MVLVHPVGVRVPAGQPISPSLHRTTASPATWFGGPIVDDLASLKQEMVVHHLVFLDGKPVIGPAFASITFFTGIRFTKHGRHLLESHGLGHDLVEQFINRVGFRPGWSGRRDGCLGFSRRRRNRVERVNCGGRLRTGGGRGSKWIHAGSKGISRGWGRFGGGGARRGWSIKNAVEGDGGRSWIR